MKKCEVSSPPKAKTLFLLIVSVIAIVLFSQYFEFKVLFSLKIFNINAASPKKRWYRTSAKPLTVPQQQLHEDLKTETKAGRHLEQAESNPI